MNRTIFICLICLLFAGCNETNKAGQKVINSPTELCMQGVVYYRLGHGVAAAFNRDSTVRTCGK